MTKTFVGRQEELRTLEESLSSSGSELIVVYGRRRIGKSTILEKFVEDKPRFFYLGGRETKQLQLRRFVRELGGAVGDTLLGQTHISTWDEALTLLDRALPALAAPNGKAIVILDEFQWMCRGAEELLSDLQRFWDKKWQKSDSLMLILCGSSVSFMMGDVLSRKSPLFGRRTRSLRIEAFPLDEAALFLPGWGRREVVKGYLAVGGVPRYLELLERKRTVEAALQREAFQKTGFLFDEIEFVLSEQLQETENYFRLLEQIAIQPMGVRELERATGIGAGQLAYYLDRLQLLGFVSRHLPFGAGPRSKTVRYRLEDYYLRFYFAFIRPSQEQIKRQRQGISFVAATRDRWHPFAGLAFEQLVRDHADRIVRAAGYDVGIREVASFWQRATKRKPGLQLDAVIDLDADTMLVCECKWTTRRVGCGDVDHFLSKLVHAPNPEDKTVVPVIVCPRGVTKDAAARGVEVVMLDSLFATPGRR